MVPDAEPRCCRRLSSTLSGLLLQYCDEGFARQIPKNGAHLPACTANKLAHFLAGYKQPIRPRTDRIAIESSNFNLARHLAVSLVTPIITPVNRRGPSGIWSSAFGQDSCASVGSSCPAGQDLRNSLGSIPKLFPKRMMVSKLPISSAIWRADMCRASLTPCNRADRTACAEASKATTSCPAV
jgi:hypothetical protein